MKNETKTISRRTFVGGSTALAGATAMAGLFGAVVPAAAKAVKTGGLKKFKPISLTDYHCTLVHDAMSKKLSRIVADPNVSSRDTAHALLTTRCPCCDTQINASHPIASWEELGKAHG